MEQIKRCLKYTQETTKKKVKITGEMWTVHIDAYFSCGNDGKVNEFL